MSLDVLMNKETILKGVLVYGALNRQPLPVLDFEPVLSGDWTDIVQILKGARNGAFYGARIRFAHSLVMAILFSKEKSWPKKIKTMLDNSWSHAKNLGSFAFIFKILMALLRRASGKAMAWHSAVAGLLGGSVIWGTNDPIVVQINLYLLSRILFGTAKLQAEKMDLVPGPQQTAQNYKLFGSLIWMSVMYLFYNHPLKLQGSLTRSMQEIYTNADSIGPKSIQP